MKKYYLHLNANITTKTYNVSAISEYKLPDGYMVDIVTTPELFEAYLYHKNYGTKEHMFGLLKDDIDYNSFLLIVIGNLSFYISDYEDTIMD